MKNLFLLLLFSSATLLLGTRLPHQHCVDCDKYEILDSMRYIYGLPDDYFFFPHGDSICSRIIKEGIDIVPCLIERIIDTTKTQIRIAESYDYTVSDASLVLLEFILKGSGFNIKEIVLSEFYEDNKDDIQFAARYYWAFFKNSDEVNYQNRVRIYRRMENWFKCKKDYNRCRKS